jgi:hypothetical protein
VQQRRARLAIRHHLAPSARADDPVTVAGDLVALHGTDPASVFLAVQARADGDHKEVERALYEDRVLIRMLGMRRTVFTVDVDVAAVMHAACTRAIAARERRNLVTLLSAAGFAGDDPAGWLAEVEESTLRALTARGEATATELAQAEPRLREQVLLAEGKPYQAWQSISTRVLMVLAAEARIIRGRPRGSWISSQYRWAPAARWIDGGIPELPTDTARVDLVRRWLAAFGPGTAADLKWWTGLTMTEIRTALSALDTTEVDLDGQTGLVLADDLEPVADPEPWVALLPALDPTAMGWVGRDWYLGPHGPTLFDRTGNVGPTIWADGRVVGGWAHRADGTVAYRLLEDVGSAAAGAVEAAAERLAGWLGGVRVTPRFRTPLERELAG